MYNNTAKTVPNVKMSLIALPVSRHVHNPFQSEFYTERNLVLALWVSSTSSSLRHLHRRLVRSAYLSLQRRYVDEVHTQNATNAITLPSCCCGMFLSSLTIRNTSSFFTRSVQLSSPSFYSTTLSDTLSDVTWNVYLIKIMPATDVFLFLTHVKLSFLLLHTPDNVEHPQAQCNTLRSRHFTGFSNYDAAK